MANKYLNETGLSRLITKIKNYISTAKINTDQLENSTTYNTTAIQNNVLFRSSISLERANRLAFLPAENIIIEQTTDGGATWVDAGVSDYYKARLFAENDSASYGVNIPTLNNKRDKKCGVRITISANTYNVPDGTPETEKYNYWTSANFKSRQLYTKLHTLYFYITDRGDGLLLTVESATPANPNVWTEVARSGQDRTIFGNSGPSAITFEPFSFGGTSSQTGQAWNLRLTFMTTGRGGGSLTTSSTSQKQIIWEIRGYGSPAFLAINNYGRNDHLYKFDYQQNATFPAKVDFAGGTISGKLKFSDLNAIDLVNDPQYMLGLSGTSNGEVQCVSADDVASKVTKRLIFVKEYWSNSPITINANGIYAVSANELNMSIPAGYTPIGYLYINTGETGAYPAVVNLSAEGTNTAIVLKNATSSAIETSVGIKVTYIKINAVTTF